MFIILNNHDCQPDGKCESCVEISHWSVCFEKHQESHCDDIDDDSDSTVSDDEDAHEGKCDVCFKYRFMLVMLRRHNCQPEKCEACAELAHWLSCFENHKESHDDRSDSTASEGDDDIENGHKHKCGVCFKYQSMLAILHNEHECARSQDEKCSDCEEISHWTECFKQHVESHVDEFWGPEAADKCGICARLNSILVPLAQNHECDEGDVCRKCGEVSYWLSCLRRHKNGPVENVPLGNVREPNGKCDICRKLTAILSSVTSHACTRDRCETCHETTFWTACFNMHRKHHGERDVLSCPNCGKRFSGARMLNIHRPYCDLAPFACDKCDRGFLNVFSLKKHKLTHLFNSDTWNGCERFGNVYKCSKCPATFRYKSVLKKHERAHSENYPFWCKLCGTRFRWFNSLINHSMMKECSKS